MLPYLRALAFALFMAATFVLLVPAQMLARRRGWPLQHKIQTGFCRVICAILGVKVAPWGALPAPGPRFVVANHVSWTDIVALASLHPFVFLAKSEVARWPMLGFLARLQATIFVPRGSRTDIPRVNAALSDALREGRDLVVFPEGTSSDGAGVLPFKPAHFEPLQDIDAMITPVALLYTDGEKPIDVGWYADMTFLPHLWGLMKRRDIVCRIRFGSPIDAAGKDRKLLAAETHVQVRALLEAARGIQATRRSGPPKYSR